MKLRGMKRRIYKFFVIFCVIISMNYGAFVQSEMSKMLEWLTGEKQAVIREIDEEVEESGDNKKHKKRKKNKDMQ